MKKSWRPLLCLYIMKWWITYYVSVSMIVLGFGCELFSVNSLDIILVSSVPENV